MVVCLLPLPRARSKFLKLVSRFCILHPSPRVLPGLCLGFGYLGISLSTYLYIRFYHSLLREFQNHVAKPLIANSVDIIPPVFPEVMALGPGAESSHANQNDQSKEGVNFRLINLLKEMKGKRLGIVVIDFFEEPKGLIDLLLDF